MASTGGCTYMRPYGISDQTLLRFSLSLRAKRFRIPGLVFVQSHWGWKQAFWTLTLLSVADQFNWIIPATESQLLSKSNKNTAEHLFFLLPPVQRYYTLTHGSPHPPGLPYEVIKPLVVCLVVHVCVLYKTRKIECYWLGGSWICSASHKPHVTVGRELWGGVGRVRMCECVCTN